MGRKENQELIYQYGLLAPTTKSFGKYNGAATVARAEWLELTGHSDKTAIWILFDLLRLKIGQLHPSAFSINDYLEAYRRPLEVWLERFNLQVPALSWWISGYSFDLQLEAGQLQFNEYNGDFAEWVVRRLSSILDQS